VVLGWGCVGDRWSQFIFKDHLSLRGRIQDGDEIKRSCFRVALGWAALALVEGVFVYISLGLILLVWSGLVRSRYRGWECGGVGTGL
jgi:hypothetical protein